MASDGIVEDRRSILDAIAFRHRLDEEVARVRRSGGFLSLALIHVTGSAAPGGPDTARQLSGVAERLRRAVRLEDILGQRAMQVVLLMPDTTNSQAARAAERLLAIVNATGPTPSGNGVAASAGLATTYGEVEGGGAALLTAAEEALREAAPGQFARSRTLEGRPRLLVIDDDPTFAETLAEAITERGWEGHPCTDVADARTRVKEATYSGFFIDVVLPTSSGIEILTEAMADRHAASGRPHERSRRRRGADPGCAGPRSRHVHAQAADAVRPGLGARDVPQARAGHPSACARGVLEATGT